MRKLRVTSRLWPSFGHARTSLESERGNVIVTLVLAVAVLGILTTVAGDTFSTILKRAESGRNRQLVMSQFERLRLLVSGVDSCTTLLTTAPIAYSTSSAMSIASLNVGSSTLTVGTQGELTIASMALVHEATLPQVFDATGVLRDHHRARLDIAGQIENGNRISGFVKSYAVDVVLNGAGTITNCARGQDPRLVACQVVAGTYQPVTGTCDLPTQGPVLGTCPSGQCIYGFDAQNQRLCRPM